MKDFKMVVQDMGMWNEALWRRSENVYTFETGSTVTFYGAEDEQKLRGLASDIAWLEEANEITEEAFRQIDMRCTFRIITSFNPSMNDSWLYNLPDDKTILLHSTYKDNPFLSKEQVDVIESYKELDDDYYQVYALGKRCFSRENVFSQFEILDHKPFYLDEFVYAIDYGYTHPCALLKVWYTNSSEYKNVIFVEELLYSSGLTTKDLLNKIENMGLSKDALFISDTNKPELFYDIKNMGYNMKLAVKDVRTGILTVKQHKVYLHKEAVNTIKENLNYKWRKVNGVTMEEPLKVWDDAMDAMRYAIYYIHLHLRSIDDMGVYNFDL